MFPRDYQRVYDLLCQQKLVSTDRFVPSYNVQYKGKLISLPSYGQWHKVSSVDRPDLHFDIFLVRKDLTHQNGLDRHNSIQNDIGLIIFKIPQKYWIEFINVYPYITVDLDVPDPITTSLAKAYRDLKRQYQVSAGNNTLHYTKAQTEEASQIIDRIYQRYQDPYIMLSDDSVKNFRDICHDEINLTFQESQMN